MDGNATVDVIASLWIESVGSKAVCSEAPRVPLISETLAGSPAVGEIPPNPLSFQLV